MKVRGGSSHRTLFAAAAVACLALLGPAGASAATVVNGDFESGTLAGWHVQRATEAGNWFAYEGVEAPISSKRANGEPVQAPPQGDYAAISDEANPDTLILYQDVVLRPDYSHRLSLLAYYDSYEPIAVPTPNTLSVEESLGGQANQQYRIDVVKPGAPLESLDPADILRTVFRTQPGDPMGMEPTRLTADLSQFAGQTVRLRIANAVTDEVFNAGVDAISVASAPSGAGAGGPSGSKPPGSVSFGFGKVKANRKNGTAILPVKVPKPGTLTAKGTIGSGPGAEASGSGKPRAPIKPATVKAADAGTVAIRLKPTPFAFQILKRKHKLRVKVAVTYTPTGGSPETATVPVVLKLKASPHPRR